MADNANGAAAGSAGAAAGTEGKGSETQKTGADQVESLGGVFNREHVPAGAEYKPPAADADAAKAAADAAKAAADAAKAEADGKPAGDDDDNAAGGGVAVTPKAGTFYRDGKELPGNYVPESRLDELTRQNADLARRLEDMERKGRPERPPEGQEPWKAQLKARPEAAAFQTTEDYIDALTDVKIHNDRVEREGLAAWRAEQDKAAGGKAAAGAAPDADAKAKEDAAYRAFQTEAVPKALQKLGITLDAFNKQVISQRDKFATLEITEENQRLVNGVLLNMGPEGAELVYHLGAAPVEYLQRVVKLPAAHMVLEIARMAARVELGQPIDGSKPGAGADGGKPKESQAADPPGGVRGGGNAGTKDPGEMDMVEYAEWRKAEKAAGRG